MFLKKIVLLTISCFNLIHSELFSFSDTNATTGNEIIVWDTYTPSGFDILASVQIAGAYSPSVTIANPLNDPRDAIASINSSDQVVAVWIGYDIILGVQTLFASSYQLGVWSLPVIISDPLVEQVQSDFQVKVADNGNVVITWKSYLFFSGTFVMRGMHSNVFGSWSLPVTIL